MVHDLHDFCSLDIGLLGDIPPVVFVVVGGVYFVGLDIHVELDVLDADVLCTLAFPASLEAVARFYFAFLVNEIHVHHASGGSDEHMIDLGEMMGDYFVATVHLIHMDFALIVAVAATLD